MSSSGSTLGGYFGSFGETVTKLGQIADQVGSQLDGGIRNVGLNLAQATRSQFSQTGQPSGRRPSRDDKTDSTSSSSVSTPDELPSSRSTANANSGSMGSGGLSATRNRGRGSIEDTVTSSTSMGCDSCNAKLGFLTRKKTCYECKNVFCRKCVATWESSTSTSSSKVICDRCTVLLQRPPVRTQLMDLRVRDLQRYLLSKKVNTKACKEKEDLVELVILENGGSPRTADGISPNASAPTTTTRRDPIERQKSFPKSYVASTHRSDWFEKMEVAGATASFGTSDEVEDFVLVPSPERENATEDRVEAMVEENVDALGADTTHQREVGGTEVEPEEEEDLQQAKHGQSDKSGVDQPPTSTPSPPTPNAANSRAKLQGCDEQNATSPSTEQDRGTTDKTRLPRTPDLQPLSQTCSPKKFANQGLVYLSDIHCVEDLQELSAKQMKDMLAMNRVNFKGVVEKQELFKIVERVWRQHVKSTEEKDTLEDEDMCKICMDNQVDCVMLECGHMCTCLQCGKQLSECPICRAYVIRVVKIFKS